MKIQTKHKSPQNKLAGFFLVDLEEIVKKKDLQ